MNLRTLGIFALFVSGAAGRMVLAVDETDARAQRAIRDSRVGYEISRFDIASIDAKRHQDWAVLDVWGGANGGVNGDDLVEIQKLPAPKYGPDENGDYVAATARLVCILRGSVEAGKWPCYAPTKPRAPFGWVNTACNAYAGQGLCICRVDANTAAGRAALNDRCLIPDAWADKVQPALEFWRDNHDIFKAPATDSAKAKLRALLTSENPAICYFAARRYPSPAASSRMTYTEMTGCTESFLRNCFSDARQTARAMQSFASSPRESIRLAVPRNCTT